MNFSAGEQVIEFALTSTANFDQFAQGTWSLQTETSPVPEPLTMLAVGMGIAGLGGYIRRRRARL